MTPAEWLVYANQGATRSQPLAPELVEAMKFLPEIGLQMQVFSGGQPGIGTSSARVGACLPKCSRVIVRRRRMPSDASTIVPSTSQSTQVHGERFGMRPA